MKLYSETPGLKRNGNKCRDIFEHKSPDELPNLENDSMFLLLFTEEEFLKHRGTLAEKLRGISYEGVSLIEHIEKRTLTHDDNRKKWYLRHNFLFPSFTEGETVEWRTYSHGENTMPHLIVLSDLLNDLESFSAEWFENGRAIGDIFAKVRESLLSYAKQSGQKIQNLKNPSRRTAMQNNKLLSHMKLGMQQAQQQRFLNESWQQNIDEVMDIISTAQQRMETDLEEMSQSLGGKVRDWFRSLPSKLFDDWTVRIVTVAVLALLGWIYRHQLSSLLNSN